MQQLVKVVNLLLVLSFKQTNNKALKTGFKFQLLHNYFEPLCQQIKPGDLQSFILVKLLWSPIKRLAQTGLVSLWSENKQTRQVFGAFCMSLKIPQMQNVKKDTHEKEMLWKGGRPWQRAGAAHWRSCPLSVVLKWRTRRQRRACKMDSGGRGAQAFSVMGSQGKCRRSGHRNFSIPAHLHLPPVYYASRLLLHCSNWAFFCSNFAPAAHSWGFVYFPAGFWLLS